MGMRADRRPTWVGLTLRLMEGSLRAASNSVWAPISRGGAAQAKSHCSIPPVLGWIGGEAHGTKGCSHSGCKEEAFKSQGVFLEKHRPDAGVEEQVPVPRGLVEQFLEDVRGVAQGEDLALGHDGGLLWIAFLVDATVIPGSWQFCWGWRLGWQRSVVADIKTVLIVLGADLLGGQNVLHLLVLVSFLLVGIGLVNVGIELCLFEDAWWWRLGRRCGFSAWAIWWVLAIFLCLFPGRWWGPRRKVFWVKHCVEVAEDPGLESVRGVSERGLDGSHCEFPGPGSTFGGQCHDGSFDLVFGWLICDGVHIGFEVNWQFTHFPCGFAVVSVNSLEDAFENVGSKEWNKWENGSIRSPCIGSQWNGVLNGRRVCRAGVLKVGKFPGDHGEEIRQVCGDHFGDGSGVGTWAGKDDVAAISEACMSGSLWRHGCESVGCMQNARNGAQDGRWAHALVVSVWAFDPVGHVDPDSWHGSVAQTNKTLEL